MNEPRLTGTVAWFRYGGRSGSYGVIIDANGIEYFARSSNLIDMGGLHQGQAVSFLARPRRWQGGLEAYAVQDNRRAQPQNQAQPQPNRSGYTLFGVRTTLLVGGARYQPYFSGPLAPPEEVQLLREPDNPVDRNAIQVVRLDGVVIGYLNRWLAQVHAQAFDAYADPVPALVVSVWPPTSDSPEVVVIRFEAPTPAWAFDPNLCSDH